MYVLTLYGTPNLELIICCVMCCHGDIPLCIFSHEEKIIANRPRGPFDYVLYIVERDVCL